MRPVPDYTDREIARIQERFANFVLQETVQRVEDASAILPTGGVASTAGEEASSGSGTTAS